MSILQPIREDSAAQPVLTERDILFRLALVECDASELQGVEADIDRYEATGLLTARLIKLLSAASKKPE